MSGIPVMQPDFFETGLGGVLRVAPMPTTAQATENQTSGDLNRFTEPRATHPNSSAAFHGTVNLRRDRCSIILGLFQDNPARAFTDREVLARLYPGSGDLNMVRPRITELVDEGLLMEGQSVRCAVTGKLVRACGLNTQAEGRASRTFPRFVGGTIQEDKR